MPLSFPSLDHVPLKHPPLKEVVCQVRFPTLLKLAQSTPADFQEAIMSRFPKFGVEQGIAVSIDFSQFVKPEAVPTLYRFADFEETKTVSLAPDFYALSVTKYRNWTSFEDDLRFVTEAIVSTYNIRYATRIGLRYINFLTTANTHTNTFSEVLAILKPELTALGQLQAIPEVDFSLNQLRTSHEDGKFSFRSGILQENEELTFVLDFDQYIEGQIDLDVNNLLDRCNRYHETIYNAFRWAFLEKNFSVFDSSE